MVVHTCMDILLFRIDIHNCILECSRVCHSYSFNPPKFMFLIDLQQMMAAITSEPVKGANVTVKLCSPSIHIRNITTEQCNDEFLEFYFSNPKMSGGGEVESIKILSDNEAVATFSDPAGMYGNIDKYMLQ